MGRQTIDQCQLFYLFNLEGRIPAHHLLRRINPTVTRIPAGVREKLEARREIAAEHLWTLMEEAPPNTSR
jgi:hypothetical protein